MKQIISFYLFFILICSQVIAQNTATHYALSASGKSLSNDTLQIDFTLGEVSVNAYSIPGFEYIEGFQNGGNAISNQTILLESGWNLISLNILPSNDSVAVIFSDISPVLLEVKNTSLTYNPNLPDFLNSLHRIDLTSGYWVNVSSSVILEIEGGFIDPSSTPVSLTPGWNLVAYLNRQNQDVSLTSDAIGASLQEIKDMATTFNPDLPDFLNTLHILEPGNGYWIKVSSSVTFYYNL